MRDLPIFLNMRERPAVVVGAVVVAARRAELAVRAGARVTVFARALSDEFFGLKDAANFRWFQRDPTLEDFEPGSLCFVATEDEALIERARSMARAAGALVNVADRPKLSDFIMPSIVDRSPLVIAVSTGGASPILGRMLKARLESLIPAAYGRLADLMAGFRGRLATALPSQTLRRRFWEAALEGPIAEAALAGNLEAARTHLAREIDRWEADRASPSGEVYLVGAGPGDPDLVTFRAFRLMQDRTSTGAEGYARVAPGEGGPAVRPGFGLHAGNGCRGCPGFAGRVSVARDDPNPVPAGRARCGGQPGVADAGRAADG